MSQQDIRTLYEATPAHTFLSYDEFVEIVELEDTNTQDVLSWFKDTANVH